MMSDERGMERGTARREGRCITAAYRTERARRNEGRVALAPLKHFAPLSLGEGQEGEALSLGEGLGVRLSTLDVHQVAHDRIAQQDAAAGEVEVMTGDGQHLLAEIRLSLSEEI